MELLSHHQMLEYFSKQQDAYHFNEDVN